MSGIDAIGARRSSFGVIGDGDGQAGIIGSGPRLIDPGGYGGKPSLPTRLRHFDPLQGAAVAGTILPGSNAPLSMSEASLLNEHYGFTYGRPTIEDAGPFLNVIHKLDFRRWLASPEGFKRVLNLLHRGTGQYSDLGIGAGDIQEAFENPGPQHGSLAAVLKHWAQRHRRVRDLLDELVADLRREGTL